VVDLPEPVGPVTSTPPGFIEKSAKIFGVRQFSATAPATGSSAAPPSAPRSWQERVDAEARQPRQPATRIDVERLVEVLALLVVHDVRRSSRARPCAPAAAG